MIRTIGEWFITQNVELALKIYLTLKGICQPRLNIKRSLLAFGGDNYWPWLRTCKPRFGCLLKEVSGKGAAKVWCSREYYSSHPLGYCKKRIRVQECILSELVSW